MFRRRGGPALRDTDRPATATPTPTPTPTENRLSWPWPWPAPPCPGPRRVAFQRRRHFSLKTRGFLMLPVATAAQRREGHRPPRQRRGQRVLRRGFPSVSPESRWPRQPRRAKFAAVVLVLQPHFVRGASYTSSAPISERREDEPPRRKGRREKEIIHRETGRRGGGIREYSSPPRLPVKSSSFLGVLRVLAVVFSVLDTRSDGVSVDVRL